MQPLVLLILASVWAAVFIPPLLRSRIENRTSQSVSDFRRQLNKLQSAVPNRSGHVSMARPLAQSPLQRQAAAGRPGRPGQQAPSRRQHASPQSGRGANPAARRQAAPTRDRPGSGRYGRSHGGAEARRPAQRRFEPQPFERPEPGRTPPRGRRRPTQQPAARAQAHRQTQVHRDMSNGDLARRRRSNVMVALMLLTGATLFFATQSRSTTMLFVFALSFIATCGYLWMLSQAKQREESGGWGSDWMS